MRLLPDFTATARLKPYEGDFKGATLRLSNRSPEKSKSKCGRLARDTQSAVKWASVGAVYTSLTM